MPTGINQILTFALGSTPNVISQVTYAGLVARDTGFEAGIAESAVLNKVWRQSSFMSAVLATFIAEQGNDVLDNGNVAALVLKLKSSISAQSGGATTHSLSVAASTLTSTVNGVVATVALPGGGGGGGATSNLLSVAGNVLTSTVDGLVATANLPTSTAVGLGVGQAWGDFRASRLPGVLYVNTTGKPIMVSIDSEINTGGSSTYQIFEVDGVRMVGAGPFLYLTDSFGAIVGTSSPTFVGIIVPPGSTYKLLNGGGAGVQINAWLELR
jgi:hypothetical protein